MQDNKYVFVRGLGERYTTSSLNGARGPSPEPEKWLFLSTCSRPTGSIDHYDKDIHSRTFRRFFRRALVDIRHGSSRPPHVFDAACLGTRQAPPVRVSSPARLTGGERIGMVNGERASPSLVRSLGNFQGINLNQGDKDLLVIRFEMRGSN